MVQPCMWFKEETSQFSMGQIAQSLTCSIKEKPHTVLVLRMVHRIWKETKQQPGNMLGCCLVSFHFLFAILSTSTVQGEINVQESYSCALQQGTLLTANERFPKCNQHLAGSLAAVIKVGSASGGKRKTAAVVVDAAQR